MIEQVMEGLVTVRHKLATGIPFIGFSAGFFVGLMTTFFAKEWLNGSVTIICIGVLAGVLTSTGTAVIRDSLVITDMLYVVVGIAFLLVIPPVAVITHVEILIGAKAGAAIGDYVRAAMVGIITGSIVVGCGTQVDGYANIEFLIFALVLHLGVIGVVATVSILTATLGAVVGAAIHVYLVAKLIIRAPDEDINTVIIKAIAIGAYIGATIGALGTVNGLLIGAIMGAIITAKIEDITNEEVLKIFGDIEHHSIVVRAVAGAIRVIAIIFEPIVIVTKVAAGIIKPDKQSIVFGIVIGAITGGGTGAFAGVIGGAFVGVTVAEFLVGYYYCMYSLNIIVMGEIVLKIGTFLRGIINKDDHNHVPRIRDIGTATDKVVLLMFVGSLCATLLSVVGAFISDYFLTSAYYLRIFGPAISRAIKLMVAFTCHFNTLGSSGLAGGLLGGTLARIYRNKIDGTQAVLEAKAYTHAAAVGAVAGTFFAHVDEIIGDALWIAILGAALGAISGTVGGFITVFVKVSIKSC